jgi:hypothetical protein
MVAGYCPEMTSTSSQPCLADGSPQMKWLKSDLLNLDRTKTPWVCVVFHQPYMNSNTAHSIAAEGEPMREAIEDTLYEGRVDLVFSGTVHSTCSYTVLAPVLLYCNSANTPNVFAFHAPHPPLPPSPGHVHAYERTCAVYQYKCTPGAPYCE